MLRDLLDHPLLKQVRAAGEEQLGRAIGQVLSPSRASATVGALVSAAGEARERLDRGLRAALDAAQVPSSRDVDDLKRRLSEMEELLDRMSARLARAEAGEAPGASGGHEPASAAPDEPSAGEGKHGGSGRRRHRSGHGHRGA